MKEYIEIFKALSDETRVRIIYILLHSERELCVCEIANSLNIQIYNISKHLKELKRCNLITERKFGKYILYKLSNRDDEFIKMIYESVKLIPSDRFKENIEELDRIMSCSKF